MKLLEGENLRRRIFRSYSKDPTGWSFVISPSQKYGYYDAVVSGPQGAWVLKIDSLFKPSPIVLGSPTEADSVPKQAGPFPYGYRKLPSELIPEMLRGGGHLGDRAMAGLLSVLKSKTVVPEEGRSYAHGPFIFASPERVGLSEHQREFDDKLTSEMNRLIMLR
ncbi:MAG: hypothetical protein JRM82_01515, partial [Nitrososphaerota archaeon]|nr:hypothetical protein [Nitrososphaerota archaeon]